MKKNKSLIICMVQYVVLLFLCSCSQENELFRSDEIKKELVWIAHQECRDGSLFGIYSGHLTIYGLNQGEKYKIYFGDSLATENIASGTGEERMEFESSQLYRIPNVVLVTRNDSLVMISSDSLDADYFPHFYDPFPVRIRFAAEKVVNGITLEYHRGVSLLVSDTPSTRIRCRFNIDEGLVVIPDTIKFNATKFRLELEADTHGNNYSISAHYADSESITHALFEYEVFLGSGSNRKLTLERTEFNFESNIPSLPVGIAVDLAMGNYKIRIEKESE